MVSFYKGYIELVTKRNKNDLSPRWKFICFYVSICQTYPYASEHGHGKAILSYVTSTYQMSSIESDLDTDCERMLLKDQSPSFV